MSARPAAQRLAGLAANSLAAHSAAPAVRRSRLVAAFEGSPQCTVAVISGPPGSGKSTLVRQLLETDSRQAAVIRVAPHDDNPVALAGRLIDAVESLGDPAPGTRASITATEPGFSAVLLPGLAGLLATRNRPFLLVIDDAHLLRQAQCRDVLGVVTAGVSPGSCVVLVTRDDVPEQLAPLRAEGRLLEIGPEELAFDTEEATQLFLGLDLLLPAPAVSGLVENTAGWVVALYLTGLAMQRDGSPVADPATAASARSEKYIHDYLRSEVLGTMPPDLRTFLTRTAVLEDLTAPSCRAVAQRVDSAAALAELHQHSRLITAAGGDVFRCHHLLRDVLLVDLEREEPGLLPQLHVRAARWFADEASDLDSAVRHAKAARNLPLVAELVWSAILECIASGRPERLRLWLSGLSDHEIATDPWLTLAAAWSALQSGDSDRMGRWLLTSRAHAGHDWRERIATDSFAAHLAVLEALVCSNGLEDSVLLCDAAMAGVPVDSGFRAVIGFLGGVGRTLLRQPDEGLRWIREAEFLARALDVPVIQADTLSWEGTLAILAGDQTRGSRLIGEATRIIEVNRLDRLASSAHIITAQALLQALSQHGDAPVTLAHARRLTALVSDIAPWFTVSGRLIQARAAIALGDGALARTLIADARACMTPDLAGSLLRDLLDDTSDSLQALAAHHTYPVTLTAAEMRVLQFLPSYLSVAQIGEHLFLATNTVKSHAQSIYRKLGVSSRAEAVEVARSLGLVEGPVRN